MAECGAEANAFFSSDATSAGWQRREREKKRGGERTAAAAVRLSTKKITGEEELMITDHGKERRMISHA